MNSAAKMISDAITGRDFITFVVAGKAYTVMPPTIRVIAGAAGHLSCIGDEKTFGDIVNSLKNIEEAAKALSWFVRGDESLWEELSHGTPDEVAEALDGCFSLVSVSGFIRLSDSAKNVASLTAKSK